MAKPKMTLNEVCSDMRHWGFGTSQKTLADGIASGIFPFGRVLSVSESGVRHILILRKDYEKWKEEMISGKTSSSVETAPISMGEWDLISSHTYTQENKDIMWEVIIRGWARKSPADSEN